VLISKLLNSPSKLIQKRSAYECGFMPISDSRKAFDIHFFITGILFLLFDVEIIFLFP
jgi:NADH-quinone oxidoreductase subunit A